MQHSTSSLPKAIFASGLAAALTLSAVLPALAHGGPPSSKTHQQTQHAAPVRAHYAAPVRAHYAAPVRAHYAAPVRAHYAAPVRAHYAAPVRAHYAAPVRAHYAAPVRAHYAARRQYGAPFVQRVLPAGHGHAVAHRAPFEQYVGKPHVMSRYATARAVAASPLIRSVYAARERVRTIPAVYHPRYIAGRVAALRHNEIVIDPPAGSPIVVRDVYVNSMPAAVPVGTVVTLPVTYSNGTYEYVTPAYTNSAYSYGYAPAQYGYAYAPPMYCSGNSSTALYAALLPAVVDVLSGNGGGLNTNDLASAALTAAAQGGSCQAYAPQAYAPSPYYGSYAPAPAYSSYTVPVTYAVTQSAPYPATYATPYDACMYGDQDGDENGCGSNAYGYDAYSNYSPYGSYTPQQVQGVVVARSGNMLMVLGPNGTPTFVDAAPALQSGYTINGPIGTGQIVDAYGYYSGNTFIATAIM